MADEPLLPLAPCQITALSAATASAAAGWRPSGSTDRLPRVPEQVLVALVKLLREETEADRSAGHARARVGLRAAVTGSFGAAGMIPTEAVRAATAGGAKALRRDDIGVIAPGMRADLVLLDAPTPVHLAYRPGVPLIAGVWKDGIRWR